MFSLVLGISKYLTRYYVKWRKSSCCEERSLCLVYSGDVSDETSGNGD